MKKLAMAMRSFTVVALLAVLGGCAPSVETATQKYPETRRVDLVDQYHGQQVSDPYRWLETDVRESEEVAAWVQEQNAVARAYLDAIPERPAILRRLTELWNFERYSPPSKKADHYLYLKNDGLQNQPVLYVTEAYDADGRVLIDPNAWSEDGTIALGEYGVSEDGNLIAYCRSEAGSDWQQIHVMEIDTGKMLPDQLKWVKFSGVEWAKDGSGFYYSRYPEPPAGQEFQSTATNQMVYFHKLGTEQSEDQLVYRRPDEPGWSFWLQPTDDGKYLVLSIYRGTDPQNHVLVRDATDENADWQELIGDFDNEFAFVGNDGSRLFFLTDLDAPTKRIVAMDIGKPGRENLAEIVPKGDSTLLSADILSGRLILQYLKDVLPQIHVYDLEGEFQSEVELPGVGAVSGFTGDQDHTETFYSFESYNTPASIYRYDVTTGESTLLRRPDLNFDPDQFVVQQEFYESKDGTRVPMIVCHRKDISLDQPRPTLLYAYGGFSIPVLPMFRPENLAWMDMGGVYAVANIRGGGEYGEAWHVAGKILNKQNVFDDFIAAAEWLIEKGYASNKKLAVMGGSNGGLLVGAVMTQRPDLFGACLPIVGVMDMLRFHQFTAGQFWRDEYGSADDPEQFQALLAYSPYHNIKPGTDYPATLIMTADTDDRVVPMHSFKFGAALQAAQAGDAPILLRIETRAGHGRGTPTSKRIELYADSWSFLVKNLEMKPKLSN